MKTSAQYIKNKDLQIRICDMGHGWVVVDKPCGISIHNDPGEDLISILDEHFSFEEHRSLVSYNPDFKFHAVHRLDKETSGLLIFACRDDIMKQLATEFETGKVEKKYIALVHGQFDEKYNSQNWNTWGFSITKKAGGRKGPAGSGRRVKAETLYRILDQGNRYTLLELKLITGRKHQIRRHAKLSGHPVVGDLRYGSKRAVEYLMENYSFNRLALHSFSLKLKMPNKPDIMTFKSEKVPSDIKKLIEADKKQGE